MNTELKQRLLEMVKEDQRVRAQLAATGELFRGYAPKMAEVHRRNAQKLEAVVERFGWPGKSVVGEEASNAAWLILQHAIGNRKLRVDACLFCERRSRKVKLNLRTQRTSKIGFVSSSGAHSVTELSLIGTQTGR